MLSMLSMVLYQPSYLATWGVISMISPAFLGASSPQHVVRTFSWALPHTKRSLTIITEACIDAHGTLHPLGSHSANTFSPPCRTWLTVEFLPFGRSSRSLGSSNSSRRFLELSRTRSRTLEALEIPGTVFRSSLNTRIGLGNRRKSSRETRSQGCPLLVDR